MALPVILTGMGAVLFGHLLEGGILMVLAPLPGVILARMSRSSGGAGVVAYGLQALALFAALVAFVTMVGI